jgi:hypothetical protein
MSGGVNSKNGECSGQDSGFGGAVDRASRVTLTPGSRCWLLFFVDGCNHNSEWIGEGALRFS